MDKNSLQASIFVVSIDFNGSGVDDVCHSESEMNRMTKNYENYLKEHHLKGKINVHQYNRTKYPKEVVDDSQIFLDNYFNPSENIINTINIF